MLVSCVEGVIQRRTKQDMSKRSKSSEMIGRNVKGKLRAFDISVKEGIEKKLIKNNKETMNELGDPYQWMENPFKLKDVPDWNFPKHCLPLEVKFEQCKRMDLISGDGGEKLRCVINNYSDFAEVSDRGSLTATILFYHPFSIIAMLKEEGKIFFELFADPRRMNHLTMNFMQKTKIYDSELFWIGGIPTQVQGNIDRFKEIINEALVEEAKKFVNERNEERGEKKKMPILEFTFTSSSYDTRRGEMIVVPQIKDPTNAWDKYDIMLEKKLFLEHVEQAFKSRLIIWEDKPHLLLVKMASNKYHKLWNHRTEHSNLTLTDRETEMVQLTTKYLNEQLSSLLPKSRKRPSSESQRPHEPQGESDMVDGSLSENRSSSVQDAIVGDLDNSLSCVNGVYCDAKFAGDREVERVMLKLAQKHDKNSMEYPRTSPVLTDFDHAAIKLQLRELGVGEPKPGRKRKYDRSKDELVKLFNINGAPWLTPDVFISVGKKKESVGELEFFFAPSAKELEENMKTPEMPSYDFINYYDESDMGNEKARKKAATCPVECSDVCDLEVGCLPESCPCMQISAMNADGLVDKSKDKSTIYECCRKCPCYYRKEKCRSIVRLRPHELQSVYISPMRFTLRTLQNVQRGEIIMPFTGVRQSFTTPEDGIWSFVLQTPCRGSEFLINTSKAGNATRFCCHSNNPNCALIPLLRGGMKEVDPEMYLYARGPIEAGDLIYINYGNTFGMSREECKCTQPFCHRPEELKLLNSMTLNEGKTFFIHLEMMKRARMIQGETLSEQYRRSVLEERRNQSDVTASTIVEEFSS